MPGEPDVTVQEFLLLGTGGSLEDLLAVNCSLDALIQYHEKLGELIAQRLLEVAAQ